MEDTALLLEVRRGNDDLLFNIEPDVIMQWQIYAPYYLFWSCRDKQGNMDGMPAARDNKSFDHK